MPRARRGRSRTAEAPTFALSLGAGHTCRVWVLAPGDTLRLYYTRRDGTDHVGPGLVLVDRNPCGVTVMERSMDDPQVWEWFARLMRAGLAAIQAPAGTNAQLAAAAMFETSNLPQGLDLPEEVTP